MADDPVVQVLLAAGREAEQRGDLGTAIISYGNALSLAPIDPDVRAACNEFTDRIAKANTGSAKGPILLHPAFDLRRELVLFGFLGTSVGEKTGKPEDKKLRLITSPDGAAKLNDGDSLAIEDGGRQYVLDTRYDSPPRIEDQWDRADVDVFAQNPRALRPVQLYEALKEAIRRHIYVADPGAEVILAIWPVISFVYPAFPATSTGRNGTQRELAGVTPDTLPSTNLPSVRASIASDAVL